MANREFFPFEIRKEQDKLVEDCLIALNDNKVLFANAPTGLGKTVASVSTALSKAIEEDKTLIFVTSRHTQHKIVVDTLKIIKQKFGLQFGAVDFIGKMWMCAQSGVTALSSGEFSEYCKTMVKHEKCPYYMKTKGKGSLTLEGKALVGEINKLQLMHVEDIREESKEAGLCPYEVACELAKKARVIIADYYHVFHPAVRSIFFKRIEKSLPDSIIIVDEAHNLPYRVRDLASAKMSTHLLNRALKEAKDLDRQEMVESLTSLNEALVNLSRQKIRGYDTEAYITKSEFISKVDMITGFTVDDFCKNLYKLGDDVLEEKKISYLHGIADFLRSYEGPDDGFARILSKSKDAKGNQILTLHYKCLDPSIVTGDVFRETTSAIVMSGTLHPPHMYMSLLGVSSDRGMIGEYDSPFESDNRLSVIVPRTSTKFTQRSPQMYEEIAKICVDCAHSIPGNVAIFVPSYNLLDHISQYFDALCTKTTFKEHPGMSKYDRETMLNSFRAYSKVDGAVLFGVSGGSFSEGIDLPGNELLGVVVVGLPLTRPDLETRSTIEYYDNRFGNGFDYGYSYPAFNKVLQSAGRCIRTQTDKGVIVFLDERYVWGNYYKCFPTFMHMKVAKVDYVDKIKDFFKDFKKPNF